MSNFYERRDIQAVVTFASTGLFTFDFEADAQLLFNESGSAIVEYSWDGVNVHGRLGMASPTNIKGFAGHKRRKVWLRAVAPAGACIVEVEALTK